VVDEIGEFGFLGKLKISCWKSRKKKKSLPSEKMLHMVETSIDCSTRVKKGKVIATVITLNYFFVLILFV
jgi:hypothetical protein